MTKLFVPITERYRLNAGSNKETYHLILDLSATDIEYRVGDCIAVYPHNDPHLVQKILDHFSTDGEEMIVDRKGNSTTFYTFLTEKANLVRSPKKLGSGDHVLASLQGRDDLDPQSLASLLGPLLPRFYSIASSMDAVGREAHLTVTVNENPKHFPTKYGTCSHFLCKRAPLFEPVVSIYHHPAKNFYLSPESFSKPIIMIGPGTGVAPFRGFLQERIKKGASQNWLFFGERNKKNDYYYEAEWKDALKQGHLQIETAFSRDSQEKTYVQHKLLENASAIWEWLENGAYLYVCGDAKNMAKAVELALLSIIETEGKTDPKEYIKNLKKQSRYMRDVY